MCDVTNLVSHWAKWWFMGIPAQKIYLRYKIFCLQIFRIFWLHFCWLSYAHCRLSYVSLNSHAKFWSCHTNRKGRRGNQSYWVSCLDDVGQAIQPIVFTVKTLVLMLCCGVAHWAMLPISPCYNNELPVLHSTYDYRAEYH